MISLQKRLGFNSFQFDCWICPVLLTVFPLYLFSAKPLKYAKMAPPPGCHFLYFHVGEILLRKIHLFHPEGLAVEIGQRPGVRGGKGGFRGAVFSRCENMKMASRMGCHLAYFKGLAEERCKGKTVSF